MYRVKCETKTCSQYGFIKTVTPQSAGPDLVFKAAVVCMGCGNEPAVLPEPKDPE